MALITYEHKTDGVYCGGCDFNIFHGDLDFILCHKYREKKDFLLDVKHANPIRFKRCQACIDEFGE